MDLRETLKTLSRADGPSGFETAVSEYAAELLRPYADEISTDPLGSVTAYRRCGRENAVKVMLDAHIDEVGFIVTGHEEGFLRFAPLGGIDTRILPGVTLKILADPPLYGVIDVVAPHLLRGDEAEKAHKIEDLYIDIGCAEESAKRAAPVGTPIVYASEPAELGKNLLAGKAFDDRACFAAIVRALELLGDAKLDFDLCIL
ncbi:MAG: M42 family metallopeptidase, partial [Clostridiales bacterium]|nr:M42 family metallopeptidase [Clostridiales bacterium]